MTPHTDLTPTVAEAVARQFKVLAEPARLALLNALKDGERTVSELMADTALGQANVSKHLKVLRDAGFVTRRKDGLHVFYALRDEDVFTLCDIMCGRLQGERPAARRRLAS